MPWLDRLCSASGVDQLHISLAARHPLFSPLHRCAVVGAGGEGSRFVEICARNGIAVVAVADDHPRMRGSMVGGHAVTGTEALYGLDRDLPIVMASHRCHGTRMALKEAGFRHVELLSLLQVLDPATFTPHMFFDGWLPSTFANRDRIAALAGRLGDDASRATLDALIGFRLTLDAAILAPVTDFDVYHSRDLIALGEDEVYVDSGAFDGDSIRLFIDRVNNRFDRIIGFEPDSVTFQSLAANFKHDPRVVAVNKGLWSKEDVLRFHNDASRGAILHEDGGATVPVTSLDAFLGGERVSYVKMNIEGAEIAALEGARQSILRWKPRLAVSLYHRPEDLWEIPAVINAICPEYRLYLRQQDVGVIETVLYALP